MEKRIICLIPARGGSKRLPRKNLLEINGLPLISYTIRAAQAAGVFSKIVLSTDDNEIARIARGEGVEVDIRPESMGHDDVNTIQVLEEYLERTNAWSSYDMVCKMLPTCPFRSASDVKNGVQRLIDNPRFDFLISVREYEFPVNLALKEVDDHQVEMNNPKAYIKLQSQDQENFVHPNGGFYLARTEAFHEERTFFTSRMLSYKMPAIRSIDIDYNYQFQMAKVLMETMPEIFNDNPI